MAMVLVAAFFHACWNYLAKKSLNKIVFIWWFLLAALVIYLPMLIYFRPQLALSRTGWLCVAATLWALLTGGTIAAYSLVDKVGVSSANGQSELCGGRS